jgi:hypothetical protein
MTLAELRDKADARLATFWTALVTKEEAYFAKHGKYFQLLVTPETNVVDGVDSDFTTRHPSDEPYQIDVDFQWATKIPFNIRVDEWVGEKEDKGFEAHVKVMVGEDTYCRIRNSKNEDTGWFKYVEPAINI